MCRNCPCGGYKGDTIEKEPFRVRIILHAGFRVYPGACGQGQGLLMPVVAAGFFAISRVVVCCLWMGMRFWGRKGVPWARAFCY